MEPSGTQYPIEAHGYAATVTEVGATLRELTHQGRPLVAGFAADELRPVFRGAVLAPWPNRIADGRYEFDGVRHQLPLTEPDRSNALHGLLGWAAWTPISHDAGRVRLGARIHPCAGYPFRLDVEADYALGADGLGLTLRATNVGDRTAPYGCALHPYLVAGAGHVDDWTLEVAAARYLEVTPDRLLPTRTVDTDGTPFDFSAPRSVGDVEIDHAFTGFAGTGVSGDGDGDGTARLRLTAADGHGVEMRWEPTTCPWLQLHTADRPEHELNRAGLAVEPMTCPPDAFNSGIDLVRLGPGDTHETTWTIAAL